MDPLHYMLTNECGWTIPRILANRLDSAVDASRSIEVSCIDTSHDSCFGRSPAQHRRFETEAPEKRRKCGSLQKNVVAVVHRAQENVWSCQSLLPAPLPVVSLSKLAAVPRLLAVHLWIATSSLILPAVVVGEDVSKVDREFFESRIRPILVEQCYECHSAESDSIGGGFRLDSRRGMLEGGESGSVVLPGNPDESLLLKALRYDGIEMPPDEPLPESVVQDFATWIARGASDPRPMESPATQTQKQDRASLWSFLPRSNPNRPSLNDSVWPRDSLDEFVLARIESEQLAPVEDAGPRTLIRRLHYDLVGLPPSNRTVESFTQAHYRASSTHEKQRVVSKWVDRLLASPQFGVRWGRHWLDVARYGESNGDDGLGRNATFPHAWRYRDYVIDAFNRDLPYNQFLTEQIAGDLLPAANAEQRNRQLTATGFLAIGSKPAAAMNKNFAMDVVDDQINVVCTAVLGLSVACARCHDHKHDPIPTRDYYALAGIFSSTETLYGAAGNEKLTAPPTQLHELRSQLQENESQPDRTIAPQFPQGYLDATTSLAPLIHESLQQPPRSFDLSSWNESANVAEFATGDFASVKDVALRGNFEECGDSYSVAFWFRNKIKNDARPITAYLFSRAAWGDKSLPGDHLGIGGNHEKSRSGKLFVFNGNGEKKSIAGRTVIAPNSWNHIVLVRDGKQVRVFLNGRKEIDAPLPSTFGKTNDFSLACRSDQFAPLTGNVGEFSAFNRSLDDHEAFSLHRESGQPIGLLPIPVEGYAMGVRDKAKVGNAKIHLNGDGSKLGAEVPRGFLTAYESLHSVTYRNASESSPIEGSGRLALSKWLTDPDHPQTARVIVNRVWMHLMGSGLVATPDDFGVYGSRPTHPMLLDHLANGFVEQGWSIKSLIRRIVLSRTYQLSSEADSLLLEADPDNRWLARHNRRRLDAESLRDSVLTVTGQLDRAPAEGSAIQEIDALINWPPGEATNLHRKSAHRSVYLCLLRHSPPKELAAFDLPRGVDVCGRREVTMLPTQTLFLLNSDFVVSKARLYADQLLGGNFQNDRDRVCRCFEDVLQRAPTAEELDEALAFLQDLESRLEPVVAEPFQLRRQTWASYCQALWMINEFRYVD